MFTVWSHDCFPSHGGEGENTNCREVSFQVFHYYVNSKLSVYLFLCFFSATESVILYPSVPRNEQNVVLFSPWNEHNFVSFSPRNEHNFPSFSPWNEHKVVFFSPRNEHNFLSFSPRNEHNVVSFSPRNEHEWTSGLSIEEWLCRGLVSYKRKTDKDITQRCWEVVFSTEDHETSRLLWA